METVGIGMIGSGFMGLTYSEVVSHHASGCKLVAITGGKRSEKLAADYSVPCEPTVESLLARPDVAAVVLATPDQDRPRLTRLAAAAGKHVLAEKPMAPTVAECDQMIADCSAAGVNLAVVKTERFRKITQRAKQLIDDGTIGPIRMMRTVSAFPLSLTKQLFEERPWMADSRGGGLFMGMASHNADFLLADWSQRGEGVRSGDDLQRRRRPRAVRDGRRSNLKAASWLTCGSLRNCPRRACPVAKSGFKFSVATRCSTWRTSSSSTSAKETSGNASIRRSDLTISRSRSRRFVCFRTSA